MIISVHYHAGMLEAARIADRWSNTEPVLEESNNPQMAKIIATVMSNTAKRIVEEIRAEAIQHRPTVRESIQKLTPIQYRLKEAE